MTIGDVEDREETLKDGVNPLKKDDDREGTGSRKNLKCLKTTTKKRPVESHGAQPEVECWA